MATIDLGGSADPLIFLSGLRTVLALTVSWPSATESWKNKIKNLGLHFRDRKTGFQRLVRISSMKQNWLFSKVNL